LGTYSRSLYERWGKIYFQKIVNFEKKYDDYKELVTNKIVDKEWIKKDNERWD